MARYEYAKLDPEYIRILFLEPGIDDAPLKGELNPVALTALGQLGIPSFEALSYVWGNESKPQSFWTPSGVIPLTQSLFSALSRLRDPHQERILWADAICINQSDAYEKEIQVSRMGDIYSSASAVVCDLGEDSADSDTAIDLLDRYWRKQMHKGWRMSIHEPALTGDETAMLLGLKCPTKEEADAIEFPIDSSTNDPRAQHVRDFLSRPWFARLWVVQEFVLAREVHMLVGRRRLSGQELMAAMFSYGDGLADGWPFMNVEDLGSQIVEYYYYFLLMGIYRLDRTVDRATIPEGLNQKMLKALSGAYWGPTGTTTMLSTVLNTFSACKTSHARDRYFAALALASDVKGSGLAPDYTSPLETVVSRYGRFILSSKGGVESFLLCGISRRRPRSQRERPGGEHVHQLPSWMPVYTSGEKLRQWSLSPFANINFNAAGDSRFVPQFDSVRGNVLHLVGCRVDAIDKVGRHVADGPFTSPTDGYAQRFKDALVVFGADHEVLYPNGEHVFTAIWKTLCHFYSKDDVDALAHGFSTWHLSDLLADLTTYSAVLTEEQKQRNYRCLIEFLERMSVAWNGKHARSRRGYFCSVPAITQPSDEIWILSGCRLPVILRPDNDKGMFRLVGASYVYGCMEGEFLNDQNFKLRGISML
jgi:hypothetical protein